MKTGASTSCLFPMLTEDALTVLTGMGVHTVEVFLNSPSEKTPEFADCLNQITGATDTQIVSVHPYSSEAEGVSFFSGYGRRFDDEAEEYRRYFEFCNRVGAQILVFHGARSFMPIEPDFYFERFARLRDIARGFGVRLCQENVARCHSGTPKFIERMIHAIPDVEFVLDVKQAVRAGVTPFEMLDAMDGHLAHLHLSDHRCDCDCLALGEGEFDLTGLARRLKTMAYGGAVLLELYSWNFSRQEQLAEGVRLFESLL
ncbi:sugar phosphate isomerase/epimerase family protein [Oscillospiraceae bacterium LTW-04]|nr:sugar phosphate isomerase/epimerase [Oscillospiraceae bacterium MB24-C1]